MLSHIAEIAQYDTGNQDWHCYYLILIKLYFLFVCRLTHQTKLVFVLIFQQFVNWWVKILLNPNLANFFILTSKAKLEGEKE